MSISLFLMLLILLAGQVFVSKKDVSFRDFNQAQSGVLIYSKTYYKSENNDKNYDNSSDILPNINTISSMPQYDVIYAKNKKLEEKVEELKNSLNYLNKKLEELKQKGIEPHFVNELLGHSSGNIDLERYGKGYNPDILYNKCVKKIFYETSHTRGIDFKSLKMDWKKIIG